MTDRTAEREIKQITKALFPNAPTTTQEGEREYRRLERQVQEIVKKPRNVGLWQQIRMNIIENLELLDAELVEMQKKKGR